MKRTDPSLGLVNPLIVRSSVVFPAPFAPSTAVIWPTGARRLNRSQCRERRRRRR